MPRAKKKPFLTSSLFVSFHVLCRHVKRQRSIETETPGLLCFAAHSLTGRDVETVDSFFSLSHSILFSPSAIQTLLDAFWMHCAVWDTQEHKTPPLESEVAIQRRLEIDTEDSNAWHFSRLEVKNWDAGVRQAPVQILPPPLTCWKNWGKLT